MAKGTDNYSFHSSMRVILGYATQIEEKLLMKEMEQTLLTQSYYALVYLLLS